MGSEKIQVKVKKEAECMKQELLQEIVSYWGTRAEGYSEVNEKELAGSQREAWLHVLEEQFPEKKKEELKILDIGTGPGFFPMILSEAGYSVTAVDYTEEMLEKAEENLGKYTKHGLERVTLLQMDAQNLEFADETFDVVISRNLTWNLEKPEQAYREWTRVLKPGGVLLNFDANWYGYLYDEEKKEAYEADRKKVEEQQLDDHYLCTDIDRMENIARQVPLSAMERPSWDTKVLKSLGICSIRTDSEIWKHVWSEEERLNYASTPMFLVRAEKNDECKEQIVHYWEKRSESFLEQRRSELANPIAKRWMKEITKQIPAGRRLKILDVGCGAGFFSILLAKEGHEVYGIDLTPEMIENAIQLAEEENADCRFQVMDAENPMFADETFDVVISRNLTWTLPNAEHAYGEWMRVLKTGGVLLNFDANYGKEDVSDTKGLPEEHAHFKVGNEMLEECERIKSQLPISRKNRPAYDVAVLCENTEGEIRIDTSLGKRIYLEKDEFYNPAPMFAICAVKQ